MDRDSIIRKHLENWQPTIELDSHMKQRVMSRIAANGDRSEQNWLMRSLAALLNAPLAGVAMAALLLVATLLTVQLFEQRAMTRALVAQRDAYFRLISPADYLDSMGNAAAEAGKPSLVDMLAWMRSNFDLTQEQFVELVSVHQSYDSRLDNLYGQLVSLQDGYATFEKRRLKDESIDFVALYQLLQRRDAVIDDARATSHELVAHVLTILRPEQRDRFLLLLQRADTPQPPTAYTPAPWNRVRQPTLT